jgi:U3 small nucleolar RNA-associated protein 21
LVTSANQASFGPAGSLVKKANSLSVKAMSLKFQPITAIASSSTRSKDWEDVVTAHVDDAFARTWRVQEKKAGRWSFEVAEGNVKVRFRNWKT